MQNDLFVPLFEAPEIYLDAIDYEKDAPVESRWSHDLGYLRALSPDLARPLSIAQVKKKYESIEKQAEEHHNLFYFQVRRQPRPNSGSSENSEAGRLLGFCRVYWIEWAHGSGTIQLGIGNPDDRRNGYGSQVLRLLLRYVFGELNFHRVSAHIPGYNQAALGLFKKHGFTEEVRRREVIFRDGRHWDMLHLGLLGSEWETIK